MPTDHIMQVRGVYSRWADLERDWQSVTIGLVLVALIVAFEIPVPW